MSSMSSSSATMRRDVRIHLTNPMVSIEDSNHGSPQRLVHRKILSEIQTLQAGDSFTDVEFVTRDVGGRDLGCGRSAVRGHSMILAAVSTFLKGWMADTFVPNLQYTVLLPDFHSTEVSVLVNILYGMDVALDSAGADKIKDLAGLLGISADLPFRTVAADQILFEGDDPQPAPDHPALVSSAPVILEERNELSASVTAEPRGQVVQDMEEAVAEQEEEECPPLVCWHCNVTLPSLEDLQDHVQIHQGELLKKTKEYRCSECKKVLSSMWKFRQHLLKHHTGPSSKNQRQQRDHMYAEYPPPSDGDEQQPSGSSHSSTQASETVAQKQNDPYPKNHGLAKDHSYGTRKRGNKDYFGSTTSQVQGSDEHQEDEEDTDDQIVTPGADDGSRTKFDHLYSAKKRKGAASKSGSRSKRMAAKKSSYRALNRAKQEAQVKRIKTNLPLKESTPLQVKTSAAKETQPPLTPSPSNRQSSRVAARQAAAAAAKASPRKTLETSRTIVQGEVFPGEKDGGRMGPPLLVPGPTTYQVEDSLYRRDSFPRPSSASTSHQKQSTSTDQTILRPKGGLELISSQGPDSTKTSTSSMGDHMYFSVPTKPSTAMQAPPQPKPFLVPSAPPPASSSQLPTPVREKPSPTVAVPSNLSRLTLTPETISKPTTSSLKSESGAAATTQTSFPAPILGTSQAGIFSGSSSSAKKKEIQAKKKLKPSQSIQAAGHSYAAARPRRISGTSAGGSRVATEAQMFPCDQCDKVFPQPYRLNRHIREVHIKERIHFCSICSKSFFKLTSMHRHELTHTEHTLWKCSKCEKIFKDQSSLKYHSDHNVCSRALKTK